MKITFSNYPPYNYQKTEKLRSNYVDLANNIYDGQAIHLRYPPSSEIKTSGIVPDGVSANINLEIDGVLHEPWRGVAVLSGGAWSLDTSAPGAGQWWIRTAMYPNYTVNYNFPATFVSNVDYGDQPEIGVALVTSNFSSNAGMRTVELGTKLVYRRGTPDISLSITPTNITLDCSVNKECQTEFQTLVTSDYAKLATELRLELDSGIKIKENTGLEWAEGVFVKRYNDQVNASTFLVKIDDQTIGRKSYMIRGIASYL
ncbi:TPA: hypothetical protein ACU18Q_004980 [Escherichia coli]|uniref:hypothetical protein n=1 Tax=Escherichia coli TaxID=562 RepID=UPI001AECD3C4|nr:hypothetical protein [Escherichia coli]MBP2795046.1 hypothetical protein [Escherichia coli]